jgi:protein ATS1
MAVLYAIGSNGSGQLGIGHKEDVSVPKQVLFDVSETVNIQEQPRIRAGGNHTLLLSVGQLLCSGDSSTGACGLESETAEPHPQFTDVVFDRESAPQTTESPIILCAATWEASIIVKNNVYGRATKVYSFGTGNKGELGLGELIFRSPKAHLIKDFPPPGTEVIDLAASVSHVVAVLNNGEAYGWGNGRKGQLGHPEGVLHSPRKITGISFKVARAVCGREFTYLVSSAADGQHVILGTDKWSVKSAAPVTVQGWRDIGASWGSIFVLLENGTLLSWGRDDHGQLTPPGLPALSQIAVGSEHVLGLSASGDVLAWGWGEHGNCGPGTLQGDVKGRWNIVASSKHLPVECKITSIGAGCATSWICVSA